MENGKIREFNSLCWSQQNTSTFVLSESPAAGDIQPPQSNWELRTGSQMLKIQMYKYKKHKCKILITKMNAVFLDWYFCGGFFVLQMVCFPAGRLEGAEADAVGCSLLCVPRQAHHADFWCSVSQRCSNLYKIIKSLRTKGLVACAT